MNTGLRTPAGFPELGKRVWIGVKIKCVRAFFIIACSIFSVLSYAQERQPKGLALYCEPPATYVTAVEYATILPGTKYSRVIPFTGDVQQVFNSGFIAKIDYPSTYSDDDIAMVAEIKIQECQALLNKYPQYKKQIQSALFRWQNALSVSKQKIAGRPKPTPSLAIPLIEIDGQKFENVNLSKVDLSSATISHSNGVSMIPFANLTAGQISVLNKTTSEAHIASDWRDKLNESEAKTQSLLATRKSKEPVAAPNSIQNSKPIAQPEEWSPPLKDISQNTNYSEFEELTKEEFVKPELESDSTPTYEETIGYIQSTQYSRYAKYQIGFGKKCHKLIIRSYSCGAVSPTPVLTEIMIVNPVDLSPVTHSEQSESLPSNKYQSVEHLFTTRMLCTNGARKVEWIQFNPIFRQIKKGYSRDLLLQCSDDDSAQKLGKAWSHLIQLFGGKSSSRSCCWWHSSSSPL